MKLKIQVKELKEGFYGLKMTRGDDATKSMVSEINKEDSLPNTTEETISIEAFVSRTQKDEEIRLLKSASFENIDRKSVDGEYLKKVTQNLLGFLRNPEMVAKNLQHVDEAIRIKMEEAEIPIDKGCLPDYLILCQGYYMPGRPSDPNYVPKNKGRMIDTVLMSIEKAHGLNQEDDRVLRFVGAVSGKDTVAALMSGGGKTFVEDEQVNTLSHHGKFSHRLHLLAILHAAQNGDLDLSLGGQKPSPRDILSLLLQTSPNIWQSVMDNNNDILDRADSDINKVYQPDVCFSTVSPFTLKSLITCFGKDVGLPHLQFAMLDSHYKQTCQMVGRLRIRSGNEDLDMWKSYDVITEALGTMPLGDIGAGSVATIGGEGAANRSKYQETDRGGIVEKKTPHNETEYGSMEEYVSSKKGDEKRELGEWKDKCLMNTVKSSMYRKAYDGGTVLHYNYNIEFCGKALEIDPDLALAKNDMGQTALHTAQSKELVDLLLQHKPELIGLRDNDGKLPEESNRYPELQSYLKEIKQKSGELHATSVSRLSPDVKTQDV